MEGCEKPVMPVKNHVITIIIRFMMELLNLIVLLIIFNQYMGTYWPGFIFSAYSVAWVYVQYSGIFKDRNRSFKKLFQHYIFQMWLFIYYTPFTINIKWRNIPHSNAVFVYKASHSYLLLTSVKHCISVSFLEIKNISPYLI